MSGEVPACCSSTGVRGILFLAGFPAGLVGVIFIGTVNMLIFPATGSFLPFDKVVLSVLFSSIPSFSVTGTKMVLLPAKVTNFTTSKAIKQSLATGDFQN